MNKRKRMAVLKHRRRRHKLEERKKSPAMSAGIEPVCAEPVVEAAQPEVLPLPKKKPVRRRKTEVTSAEAVAASPEAKATQPEVPAEPVKRRGRKKKTETSADS